MCNLTYQVLVSTMNQKDFSLYDSMNLNSDAIIINQCDDNSYDHVTIRNNDVKMYSFAERGVGLSRNSALMRASADIVEFADDDMIFIDGYQEMVKKAFEEHPEADAILFSVHSLNCARPLLIINKFSRVRRIKALKYGCARLAVRREKILYNNVFFSLLFGGGAKYGCGEDTIFLQDCIKAGLKLYKSPVLVANVKQEESSWFSGYTDRYYKDKGALFASVFPRICYLYAIITATKNSKTPRETIEKIKLYFVGIREFKKSK